MTETYRVGDDIPRSELDDVVDVIHKSYDVHSGAGARRSTAIVQFDNGEYGRLVRGARVKHDPWTVFDVGSYIHLEPVLDCDMDALQNKYSFDVEDRIDYETFEHESWLMHNDGTIMSFKIDGDILELDYGCYESCEEAFAGEGHLMQYKISIGDRDS